MTSLPADLITRLERLLEDYQLQELIEVLEAVNQSGRGFGKVELTITNHALTDIAGTFTRKPRRNQDSLLKR